ncbi:TadE/TadG family type IV pilus assembly protein [Chengkuizengella axinellae]|uniref:TadE/TadG family type IV pilus assembly protein n=1 Tax=Chengkuizengella axinellae TaxID=3064388 RepID=A0ABT9IYP5_9BACL|nr:TadE/TadG family type IV pilus assembly protein [Chengkuizengella sp. 2205SS18-9]MDP5274491.1 TadE/TadG family type IV pilus assembly protein [Chengkuizengella sp. 2205SS18-9]
MLKNEKGQSLTEFALVFPLLLIMLCGIIDFGRLGFSYMNQHLTTQEAVRLGGLGKTDEEITGFAIDYIKIDDNTSLQVSISPDDSLRKSGDYVTVTLTAPFEAATPLIDIFFPDSMEITTNSTIRVE